MLNPFSIQWLALLAYFLLRLSLGTVLIVLARRQLKALTAPVSPLLATLIVTEVIISGLIIVGAWTQYAVLASAVVSLILLFGHRSPTFGIKDPLLPFLMFGVSLCLFITGAGVFAFDLPI